MNEIRVGVQHAIDKLINRFGNPNDVIRELREVLALIDKKAGTETVQTATVNEAEGAADVPAAPEPPNVEAEPPPKKTPRKRSTGKGK